MSCTVGGACAPSARLVDDAQADISGASLQAFDTSGDGLVDELRGMTPLGELKIHLNDAKESKGGHLPAQEMVVTLNDWTTKIPLATINNYLAPGPNNALLSVTKDASQRVVVMLSKVDIVDGKIKPSEPVTNIMISQSRGAGEPLSRLAVAINDIKAADGHTQKESLAFMSAAVPAGDATPGTPATPTTPPPVVKPKA